MAFTETRHDINSYYLAEQPTCLKQLLELLDDYPHDAIIRQARRWVEQTRINRNRAQLTAAFLHEYQLNSDEGIILMSIAEALLRIPDSRTQDLFLQEKLTAADWRKHLQQSDSLLVNLSTGALLVTGKLEHLNQTQNDDWQAGYERIIGRLGAPLVRAALFQAMHYLAEQFVVAETIEKALAKASKQTRYRYSFDMLGEAAMTEADALRYFQSYRQAISAIAGASKQANIFDNPGISIKLSALYPRFDPLHSRSAVSELCRLLKVLALMAQSAGINLTLDAEETARLDMLLDIYENVFSDPAFSHWSGLGLVVQAYQKRAIKVIDWLAALSRTYRRIIPIRLVKGAYWDSEIKLAQQQGLQNFPVFTNKTATDVSYLACAKKILSYRDCFYPQFASHNAHTIAALLHLIRPDTDFELQRLHGMGEALYERVLSDRPVACRVYAPVGHYRELLPYLVRRLLENGANNSFINQLDNHELAIDSVVQDPVRQLQQHGCRIKSQIVLPEQLYAPDRKNSHGLNLNDFHVLENVQQELELLGSKRWLAQPIVNGRLCKGPNHTIHNPADLGDLVGEVMFADFDSIAEALSTADSSFKDWRLTAVEDRTTALKRTAALVEEHRLELLSLCMREAGRTLSDALAEIREVVDFCRYYAHTAETLFKQPQSLPGPDGEFNRLILYGRGPFACISPWNFPIALFIGQISAALAAGNTVIAKPANPTPLTAMRCIQLMHKAGIPEQVLQFLPGNGRTIGDLLMNDERVKGVAFTGSIETAAGINRQLAKQSEIKTLIAETGGQNIMIADSSALPEQLVRDVIQSAFNSAGQRCSALRVLYLQDEIANKVIDMLIGCMQTLNIGNPNRLDTDIGPVINQDALNALNTHLDRIKPQAKSFFQLDLPNNFQRGHYFAPALIEIEDFAQLPNEVFGPVLHLIRFKANQIDGIIDAVNRSGYGLTLGIHSRIEAHIRHIQEQVQVGNIYVNRNMIGAVVGSQPFGGMGRSGTGPKAGGPHYLHRFTVEQTVTVNTAAIGGNARLLAKDLS